MKVMELYCLLAMVMVGVATSARTSDRTITKVVHMLQDLMVDSEKEGDEERDLYAKFKCYCQDNEQERRASIEHCTKEIGIVESKVEQLQGANGDLSLESAQLKANIAAAEEEIASAEALRKKAHEQFLTEEADMTTALENMDKAIDLLAAINSDLQVASSTSPAQFMGSTKIAKVEASVRQALVAASVLLTPKQKQVVENFFQAKGASKADAKTMSPIVKVLKSMRETFADNLESARTEDKASEDLFQGFLNTKKVESKKMSDAYDEKQGTVGFNDEDMAAKKEQLADLTQTKEDDEAFLAKLLEMCGDKAKSYEKRKQIRRNEQAAIAEAISILNSEAAFDSFGKVTATREGGTGAMLLQLGATPTGQTKALRLLRSAAQRQKSLRLGHVAALLEGDNPFDVVFEEIAKMIELIEKEGEQDAKNLDWCNAEREARDKDLKEKKSQIETLEGEISDLDTDINDPTTGLIAMIATNEDDLKQNKAQQKKETEIRAEEHKDYLVYEGHLEQAGFMLKQAIEVLKKHFDQTHTTIEEGLLQEAPSTWEEGEFKGQSEGGKKVIKMLEFIKEETTKEAEAAQQDETTAQEEFEKSIKELKEQEVELGEKLAKLKETLAEKQTLLAEKKTDLEETEAAKTAIEEYLAKIKPGCDFITDNFDSREENRATEKSALEEAEKLLKETPAYKKFEEK